MKIKRSTAIEDKSCAAVLFETTSYTLCAGYKIYTTNYNVFQGGGDDNPADSAMTIRLSGKE